MSQSGHHHNLDQEEIPPCGSSAVIASGRGLRSGGGRPAEALAPPLTLAELLIGIAAISVVLAIVRQFGIAGGAVVFAAAGAFHLWFFVGRRDNMVLRRALDLLWGVVMPIVCFALDPGFLQENGLNDAPGTLAGWRFTRGNALPYVFFGVQMMVLSVWLLWGKGLARWTAMIAGALSLGLVAATLIALGLTVLTLLMFTVDPFALVDTFGDGWPIFWLASLMAAVVFWRRTVQATRTAAASSKPDQTFYGACRGVLGVLLLMLIVSLVANGHF
ncbi:MAG: hypothetical protein AB7O62_06760 [Pirellulales bacterium]